MYVLIVLSSEDYEKIKRSGEFIRRLENLGGGDCLCRMKLDETMTVEGVIDELSVTTLPTLDPSAYEGIPPLTPPQMVMADAGRTPYRRATTLSAVKAAMGRRRQGRSALRRL